MAAYYVVCWLIIACHIACLRSVATAAPALDEHFFDNVRLDVDAGRGVFEGTYTLSSSSTVFPGELELSLIQVQWSQEVMLFPMIETSKLITL
jgi:hypothetical protein